MKVTETEKPVVTVIVCAYKTGERLRATLDAILGQTYKKLQLFVIDDASGDETTSIVKAYDDERLSLIINETNLGVTKSRNKGLELANTPYVATCDHDDVWRPEKLEKQVAYMENHPDCGVVGTYWTIYVNGRKDSTRRFASTESDFLKWQLFKSNCLLHSSLLMRRSTLLKHDIKYRDNIPFGDDWKLSHELARAAEISHIPESLVGYFIHGENNSLTAKTRMLDSGAQMMHEELSQLLDGAVSREESASYFDCICYGSPIQEKSRYFQVGDLLQRITERKLGLTGQPAVQEIIRKAAGQLWWDHSTLRAKKYGPWLVPEAREHPLFKWWPVTGAHYVLQYVKAWVVFLLRKIGVKR